MISCCVKKKKKKRVRGWGWGAGGGGGEGGGDEELFSLLIFLQKQELLCLFISLSSNPGKGLLALLSEFKRRDGLLALLSEFKPRNGLFALLIELKSRKRSACSSL